MSKLPPGLYDLPITNELARELGALDRVQLAADERDLDPADADLTLARHLAAVVRQALAGVKDEDRVARQAQIVNELLASVATVDRDDHLALPPRRLASVHRIDGLRGETRPADPLIPLAHRKISYRRSTLRSAQAEKSSVNASCASAAAYRD